MERLTAYSKQTSHENGICCTHFCGPECLEVGGNCAMNCKWEEAAWSRLAAYEDTELTPEEVSALIKDWIRLCTTIREYNGIDRLRVLAEADKEGRLVVLPCKELCGSVDEAAKKILTRGDRIRVMSDAELAGLFFQFRVDAYGRSQGAEDVLPNCMESIEKWLGEPVFGCEEAAK